MRVDPQAEPPIEPERPDLEESLETTFARRTDWLRTETGMELARMSLRSAENALLPDLSSSAQADHRSGCDRTHWTGGLNLTFQLQDEEPRRALTRACNSMRRTVHDVAVTLRQIGLVPGG